MARLKVLAYESQAEKRPEPVDVCVWIEQLRLSSPWSGDLLCPQNPKRQDKAAPGYKAHFFVPWHDVDMRLADLVSFVIDEIGKLEYVSAHIILPKHSEDYYAEMPTEEMVAAIAIEAAASRSKLETVTLILFNRREKLIDAIEMMVSAKPPEPR